MNKRFTDKVVLITGAASGIGLATAKSFAEEGAKVVLADRDAEKAQQAATAICSNGGEAAAVFVDVADYASCEAMVAFVKQTYGALHIACNNAGIPSSIGGEFEDFAVAEWQRLMGVNLNGVFYSMKAEVPLLKASAGTAIVNTASVASLIAARGMAAYIASKHGVAGLTKASALDLIGHGIRVNAVCPGVTDTPMLATAMATPGVREAMEAQAPIGRVGTPEEVARAILFLASDDASYMVGSLLSVDGGVTLE